MRIAFTHNLQTSHDEEEAEFDREETVEAIAGALRALGHEVARVNVGGGSASDLVKRLEDLKPDLIFNTAEGVHGRFREAFYPGLFEELGIPFTGSDAYVCAITLDKQLTKMMLAHHGIPTPRWLFVEDMARWTAPDLTFPVIVKPNYEGSSKGITLDSIVEDPAALEGRVRSLLARYPSGLLIEEFIVGRDIVVPYLERASPATHGVLAPVSYRFDESIIGPRKFSIYDYELKCVSSDAVEVECPAPIDEEVKARLLDLSARTFRALGIRDLGRIDWRITDDGRVYFLEVNALPSLEPGAGIYLSAALAGLTRTEDVLGAVVESAALRAGIERGPNAFARARKLRVGLTYNLKRIVPKDAGDDDSEAEFDSAGTIDAIAAAIASHGHQVVRLEATPEIVRRLPDARVDLVFNVAEGIGGRAREAAVPAMLEMLGVPYTGSDAATMAIALDKALAKAVVAAAGVPVPRGLSMKTGDEPLPSDLRFPLIVKPSAEGSSKGVMPRSVVEDEDGLRREVKDQVARYRQEVIVEEFLPGREFTVALLGDASSPRVLPPMEIVFVEPDARHPVYAFGDKLEWNTKIRYDRPARIDDALRAEIERVAIGAFRALGCRDVARIDLRMDAHGQVRFIEVNPLPGISPGWSDLCLIAESIGMSYEALIGSILAPALERLRASGTRAGPGPWPMRGEGKT
jgi:D-alanine-D-alanine ligase